MVAESLFQIMFYSNMESTCLTLNSKITCFIPQSLRSMRSVRPKISKCFSFNPGLGDLGWSFLRIIAALWSDSLGYHLLLSIP